MSERESRPRPPTRLAGGKFEINKRLGKGCFGEVFRGQNVETTEDVAVKFEDSTGRANQLEHEASVLNMLSKPLRQGITKYFHFGRENGFNCMVVELLGKSIEDRVQQCKGKFDTRSVVLVAQQLIQRIEFLHSKGIVHRDIKPENFMFGVRNKVHHLYVIDFGLSKRYFDGKHAQMRSRLSLTGTARYASINAHRGYDQSRRDDLEAIGHMLMYLLRGSLPWSGLEAKSQQEKYRKIMEKKELVPIKELGAGYPDEFATYLQYCRNLEYKAKPEYAKLHGLMDAVRQAQGDAALEDHQFQWLDGQTFESLVPLMPYTPEHQPDEVEQPRRRLSCFRIGQSKDTKVE